MGYSYKPARYTEHYQNVTENNSLLGEDTNEMSTSNTITNPLLCTRWYINVALHYRSKFKFSYEYKTDNLAQMYILMTDQDGNQIKYIGRGAAAAWTAASFEIDPYDKDLLIGENDQFLLYIYSDGTDLVYIKNQQLFGFKTPVEPVNIGAGP